MRRWSRFPEWVAAVALLMVGACGEAPVGPPGSTQPQSLHPSLNAVTPPGQFGMDYGTYTELREYYSKEFDVHLFFTMYGQGTPTTYDLNMSHSTSGLVGYRAHNSRVRQRAGDPASCLPLLCSPTDSIRVRVTYKGCKLLGCMWYHQDADDFWIKPEHNDSLRTYLIRNSSGVIGSFKARFKWTPVKYHPSRLWWMGDAPGAIYLEQGHPVEYVLRALDSNGQDVPGWPISYASANPGVATIDANGVINPIGLGNATLTGSLDGLSIQRTVTVIPYNPLSVTMFGQSITPTGITCLWESSVSGGTPPYTYAWQVAYGGALDEVWSTESYFYGGGDESETEFDLKLTVTDAYNRMGSARMYVKVRDGATSDPNWCN